jgi:hypothetical protein
MDDRKFWISGVVMAVLTCVADFTVDGVLLYSDYAPLFGTVYRPPEDAQNYFLYLALAYLLFGFAITWIYRQGKTEGASTFGQGVRFGLAIAALVIVPICLTYYAVQPLPGTLVVKQCILGTLAALVLGIAVAFLNSNPHDA